VLDKFNGGINKTSYFIRRWVSLKLSTTAEGTRLTFVGETVGANSHSVELELLCE
jgi:hypothetical protein